MWQICKRKTGSLRWRSWHRTCIYFRTTFLCVPINIDVINIVQIFVSLQVLSLGILLYYVHVLSYNTRIFFLYSLYDPSLEVLYTWIFFIPRLPYTSKIKDRSHIYIFMCIYVIYTHIPYICLRIYVLCENNFVFAFGLIVTMNFLIHPPTPSS